MSWSFSTGAPSAPVSPDQLEQLIGPQFITWITGTSDWRLRKDDAVADVVSELLTIATIASRSFSAETLFNIEQILSTPGSSGRPRFIDLYLMANENGEFPQDFGDPLVDAAFWSAVFTIPRVLLPPEALTIGFRLTAHASGWTNAALNDPDVARLFGPIAPDDQFAVHNLQVDAHWSTGSNSLQLSTVIAALGEYSIDRAIIEGSLSLQVLAASAKYAVEQFRALVDGKKVKVPMIISLVGLDLSSPIRFRGAEVHPNLNLVRHLRGAHPNASALAVLETDFWLNQATSGGQFEDFIATAEKYRARNSRSSDLIDEQVLRLRLSLLFASDNEKLVAPFPVATQLSTPVQSQPRFPSPVHSWGSGAHSQVDPEDHRWRSFDFTTRSRRLPKDLHMAVRRILSAAADREDVSDGFIDAVIAWEAMVGGESAVAFRVCAALAILLDAENQAKGAASFEELQTFYSLRSKLVHGSGTLGPDAAAKRQRAVQVALTALRVIMRTPGLLGRDGASARNKDLLLQRVLPQIPKSSETPGS